jgi:hypothetical protein
MDFKNEVNICAHKQEHFKCVHYFLHIYAFIILAFQIKASRCTHALGVLSTLPLLPHWKHILSSLFVQVVYLLENSIFTLMRFNGIFTLNFIHLLHCISPWNFIRHASWDLMKNLLCISIIGAFALQFEQCEKLSVGVVWKVKRHVKSLFSL